MDTRDGAHRHDEIGKSSHYTRTKDWRDMTGATWISRRSEYRGVGAIQVGYKKIFILEQYEFVGGWVCMMGIRVRGIPIHSRYVRSKRFFGMRDGTISWASKKKKSQIFSRKSLRNRIWCSDTLRNDPREINVIWTWKKKLWHPRQRNDQERSTTSRLSSKILLKSII